MKNTYEINYNKLTICKQSYKLLDCRYNLIKIELSSEHFINMNDKSKIYYNDLINENKCKSYHIRIISDNSHVDLEIFKIKARGTQLRIFYDGNKYPMYSKCKKCLIVEN